MVRWRRRDMEQVGAGESSRLRAMGRRRPSLWCEGAALGGFTCSPTPPHPSGGPAAQVSPVLCLRGQCLRAPPTRLLLWGVPCPIETPTPQRFRAPCAEGFCGHSWAQTPGNEQFSAGSDCKVGRPSPGSPPSRPTGMTGAFCSPRWGLCGPNM